jgi:hypothetical protein
VLIGDDEHIIVDDNDSDSIRSWVSERPSPRPTTFFGKLKDLLNGHRVKEEDMVRDAETAAGMDEPQHLQSSPIAQHYHPDRDLIYNHAKAMRDSNLTVAVEQVSIFLTNDGTVITFFQVLYFRRKSDGFDRMIWRIIRRAMLAIGV